MDLKPIWQVSAQEEETRMQRPCDDTERRRPSTSQGERLQKKPTLPTPWLRISVILRTRLYLFKPSSPWYFVLATLANFCKDVMTVWAFQVVSGKEPPCQCRRLGLNPWAGKTSWRRKLQPSLVFLPGESHGQRNLKVYSPWGTTEQLSTQTMTVQEKQMPLNPQ